MQTSSIFYMAFNSCDKTGFLHAAKKAAERRDYVNAERLYQEAIFASSPHLPARELLNAYEGLADSIDALGGNSALIRAVAAAIETACEDRGL
jgi:hypothetical protein